MRKVGDGRYDRFHAIGKSDEVLDALHSQTHADPLAFYLFLGERLVVTGCASRHRFILELVDRIVDAVAVLLRLL